MKSIARQRSEIASEPSIGPCLLPKIIEIPIFSSYDEIYSSADLRVLHFDQDGLLGHVSLISLLCYSSSSLRSDGSISRTSHLKTCFAINMFAFKEPVFNPPPLLLSVCPSHINNMFCRHALSRLAPCRPAFISRSNEAFAGGAWVDNHFDFTLISRRLHSDSTSTSLAGWLAGWLAG